MWEIEITSTLTHGSYHVLLPHFEISQVSERKTSITLLYISTKVTPAPPLRHHASVQGAKIQKFSDSKKKNAKKFANIPKSTYLCVQKQTERDEQWQNSTTITSRWHRRKWSRWLIGSSIRFRTKRTWVSSSACGNNVLQGSPNCKTKGLGYFQPLLDRQRTHGVRNNVYNHRWYKKWPTAVSRNV